MLCLGLALYTGSHLKQAIDGERDLRGQIADLSAVSQGAFNAPSGVIAQGVSSLSTALSEVKSTAHSDELALAVEVLVLLVGITMLRRPASR